MPIIIEAPDKSTQSRGRIVFEPLPRYAVILHNDDAHGMDEVVSILIEVFRFTKKEATRLMLQAHLTGKAIVMITHYERAELYRDKLRDKTLCATIERQD